MIFTQSNGVGTSVRNLKGNSSTVAKMCCLVQRAIYIVTRYKHILSEKVSGI